MDHQNTMPRICPIQTLTTNNGTICNNHGSICNHHGTTICHCTTTVTLNNDHQPLRAPTMAAFLHTIHGMAVSSGPLFLHTDTDTWTSDSEPPSFVHRKFILPMYCHNELNNGSCTETKTMKQTLPQCRSCRLLNYPSRRPWQ